MTTPEQPRTAAGRALLAKADSKQDWRGVPVLADILAIEAQARPAAASELRAALEAKRGEQDSLGRFFHEPNGTVLLWSDVDAALASDAGRSVGALPGDSYEPPRLRISYHALDVERCQCGHLNATCTLP